MEVFITNFDGGAEKTQEEWWNFLDTSLNSNASNNSVFISKFEKKEIDWDDDLDINSVHAKRKDFKKYFS